MDLRNCKNEAMIGKNFENPCIKGITRSKVSMLTTLAWLNTGRVVSARAFRSVIQCRVTGQRDSVTFKAKLLARPGQLTCYLLTGWLLT
jgi:hypothetical protein